MTEEVKNLLEISF